MKTDQFCDAFGSEWLLHASDSELDSLPCDAGADICGYLKCISCMVDKTGEKMYKSLSFLAKAALTLSHSNAVAERGFSVNNTLVTKEKGSLSERSIVAVRVVKEAVRMAQQSQFQLQKMLQAVKQSQVEYYALYLEKKQKKEQLEEEERKRVQLAEQSRIEIQKSKNCCMTS